MATNKDIRVIDNRICISSGALLDLFKVSYQTLSDWEEKGCPKVARGWFDLGLLLDWRGATGTKASYDGEDIEDMPLQLQKLAYEVKWKAAQSEAIELKNAIANRDYIAVSEITETLQRFFVVLKKSLLGISRKVSNEVAGYLDPVEARKVETMVTNIVIDGLEQIAIDGIYSQKSKKRKMA